MFKKNKEKSKEKSTLTIDMLKEEFILRHIYHTINELEEKINKILEKLE
jgi:hypothetical protein